MRVGVAHSMQPDASGSQVLLGHVTGVPVPTDTLRTPAHLWVVLQYRDWLVVGAEGQIPTILVVISNGVSCKGGSDTLG